MGRNKKVKGNEERKTSPEDAAQENKFMKIFQEVCINVVQPGGMAKIIDYAITSQEEKNRPMAIKTLMSAGLCDYIRMNGEPPPRLKMQWYIAGWYVKVCPFIVKLEEEIKDDVKRANVLARIMKDKKTIEDCYLTGFYVSQNRWL